MAQGGDDLAGLSRRLRDAGKEGQGLYRALHKALKDAAGPVAKEIDDAARLMPYFPNRYAAVLAADLEVKVYSSLSGDPKVSIRVQGREHKRKVRMFNDQGVINHPVFAQGPRRTWEWKNGQTAGMRRGFFSDPCKNAEPDVRDQLMAALRETARKIAGGS